MKYIIYIVLFIYIVIAVLTIIFFNGTGDAGDSIYHYLFAKYAPIHPELFFYHWAKPVYVLLASPFAQFGLTGIKIFNALVSLTTIFLTYKTARELNIKNAIISAVIMIFTPLYYILTFSGLTEPLFALITVFCIYLSTKQKYLATCLIISFLPFVRSEGLIIIGVFGIYFLFKKHWKLLPFLLFGSIVYSIAGYFVYHDFLWIFNKIPYSNLSSSYGSGNLFHFAEQLFYVVGVPIYILFWIGFISLIRRTVKKKIIFEEQFLILFGFICFFIAHSLFWYFGIFNSMGLKRVLIGVMPMISIISLQGFNFITENLFAAKKGLKIIIQVLLVVYIIIFPFTSNPAAINWKREMMLSNDQLSAIKSANFILNTNGTNCRIICSHPYLSVALNIDCFNKNKRLDLNQRNIEQIKTGDIIVWENWFALTESNIKKKDLDNNIGLINIYNSKVDDNGREIIYSIYEKKETSANKK